MLVAHKLRRNVYSSCTVHPILPSSLRRLFTVISIQLCKGIVVETRDSVPNSHVLCIESRCTFLVCGLLFDSRWKAGFAGGNKLAASQIEIDLLQ